MQIRHMLLTNQHLRDLNPLIAGEEICQSGHSFGPWVRKYTLIHCVLRGKGTLYARGGAFPVEAGQAFLILPGEVTTYTADNEDPWHYCWIGFDGSLSARFAELPPVLSLPEAPFRDMLEMEFDSTMNEYRLAAMLHGLYAELFTQRASVNRHVKQVESYIHASYMQPIRVEQIAALLHLDRRYLSRLFREKTGQTIQEYLIGVRMEEAERQLVQGRSVKEAARACGYEDVSNFSRMYKKHYGRCPSRGKRSTR